MITVVGGGVTGLAIGLELDRLGADYVVLEASALPGGVIRSAEVDGRVLDRGPQRTRLTGRIADLVDDLGLADRVLTAPEGLDLCVYREGRLRRVPFSVADLFRRKLGREVYEVLVAPLYGGLYASDPADMVVGLSLDRVLKGLGVGRSLVLSFLRRGGRLSPPPACSFVGGMQELPDAMARRLGDRLRLDAPVTAVRRGRIGWRVETPDEAFDSESVVVCTSAGAAGDLFESIAPRAASVVRSLRYNPLAVVHLDADTDLRGLGFQVSFTESDLLLRGVTFNDSLFDRRNLYTAYLGGSRHPEVTAMSEEELSRRAVQEFAVTTGYEAEVLSVARATMPAWDTSWKATRHLDLPDGLHVAGNWWSRPGLPGRLVEAESVARALAPAGRQATAAAAPRA